MKRVLIGATWVALIVIGAALGLAARGSAQAQATPAASPTPEPAATQEYLNWQSLGGPYERVAFALALVPGARRSTVYVGTWGHGVYRSRVYHDEDSVDTWQERRGDGGRYIRTLAVLGSNLYAGTSGEGLFRSTDSGSSWRQLGGDGAFVDVPSPVRSPLRVNSLLTWSDDGAQSILVGTHNGVWLSDDLGETWRQLSCGFTDTDGAYNVQALARDPAGRLYAGTLDGLYGAGALDGLCSDQDGSPSWSFLGPPDGYPDAAHRILSLAVVTDTTYYTGTLLIGTKGAGLYTPGSDIESGQWFTRTAGFPKNRGARTVQVLLSAPNGVVYAGTVDHGVFTSTNGGQDWQPVVEGLPLHALSILSLSQDPTDDSVYAGTYGDGVYRLRSDSQRWEAANDGHPVDFPVQKVVFAGSDGERLLAGLRVGGIYASINHREESPTWSRVPQALPIGPARDVVGLAASGGGRSTVVIAASTGITLSLDAGRTWQRVTAGLPAGDFSVKALAQGRQDPRNLYTALAGTALANAEHIIYRSADGGAAWQATWDNLTPTLASQVSCLTVGDDDETVYLGLQSGQVYASHDAGATWRQLSPVSERGVRELNWSQRSAWDVFLHGGPRRMLYARAADGIYVSYDEGQSWQLRLRGFFSALLADPYRPWAVYAASPHTTQDKEFEALIPLPPDLWISDDGGETWRRVESAPPVPVNPSPASITTLAFDPKHTQWLYAGTEGAGVFRVELPSAARPYTPRAVNLMVLSLVLLGVLAFVLWTGLRLGRPYRLPPQTWPKLAYLRARYGSEVGLVSARHTTLTALQRLALALAPHGAFRPEALWQRLEEGEVPADPAQMELALKKLALDYHLLRSAEGSYWHLSALLGRMARARFWDAPEERTRLIEAVRGESLVRADIRRFFKLAGFDASSFEDGFTVRSNRPEYALLGADRGIYVHLHPATELGLAQVREAQENANRAYEGLLAGKIAYLIVGDHPEVETWQHIIDLGQEEDFRPVLLSYNRIRHTAEATTSSQMLTRSLERALGNVDLFQLHGPALDPLDFFGRETALQTLVEACRDGQVTGLAGMAKVGKTSLAWQVMDRLPGALVAWIDLNDAPTEGLYAALRQLWLDKARVRFSTWEPPRLAPPPERPTPAQIVADLGAIRDSLSGQAPATHLVAVLDGLPGLSGSEELGTLAQAVAEVEGGSLLGIFGARPKRVEAFRMLPVRPLEPRESAALVNSLAAQMALAFDPAATDRLHEVSGGHPLLLRQLASLAVAHEGGVDGRIAAADVDHAVTRYGAQPESVLSLLWDSLTGGEQEALRSAISAGLPPADDVLTTLVELGWLKQVDGGWRLFSQALDGWLRSHLPPRG